MTPADPRRVVARLADLEARVDRLAPVVDELAAAVTLERIGTHPARLAALITKPDAWCVHVDGTEHLVGPDPDGLVTSCATASPRPPQLERLDRLAPDWRTGAWLLAGMLLALAALGACGWIR